MQNILSGKSGSAPICCSWDKKKNINNLKQLEEIIKKNSVSPVSLPGPIRPPSVLVSLYFVFAYRYQVFALQDLS